MQINEESYISSLLDCLDVDVMVELFRTSSGCLQCFSQYVWIHRNNLAWVNVLHCFYTCSLASDDLSEIDVLQIFHEYSV